MAERPRVVRSDEPALVAGRLLAEALRDADAAGDGARLAVPGGSALAALGLARRAAGSAWQRVRLTWVDERCVPFQHADSNRGSAYRSGALDADDPPARELPLFQDGEDGAAAVARVERVLAREFSDALDVLLLGLGEDAHVASLFPGWRLPSGARVAFVAESPKPPPARVTLTPLVLASARAGVLLAAGEAKRAALERVLAGDRALAVTSLHGVTIVTDLRLAGGP